MNAMNVDIWQVTQELDAVLKKLSTAEGPQAAELIEQVLTPEVMHDFKGAVDAMRQLLWLYILAASRATRGDINHSGQGTRLQRATDVLRGLREDRVPPSLQTSEGNCLKRQLDALATFYSQASDSTGPLMTMHIQHDQGEAAA